MFLIIFLVVFITLALLSSRYRNATEADEILQFVTEDDIRIPVFYFRGAETSKKKLPVVLCHGMAANRFNLDLNEECSLARFLQKQGYDVYLPELRGSAFGASINSKYRITGFWDFDFDTHVNLDVPAIISGVLDHAGAKKLHWLGHSMGGMVIFASAKKPLLGSLASLTSVGSPGCFKHAVGRTKTLAYMGSVLPIDKFPIATVCRLFSPLSQLVYLLPEDGPINPKNMDLESVREVNCNLIGDVSRGLVRQAHRWMMSQTFCDAQGTSYLPGMSEANTPALFIAGSADSVASEKSVRVAHDAWGADVKEFVVFGKSAGHLENYGHGDLILGKHVRTEVFPVISEWMGRFDA